MTSDNIIYLNRILHWNRAVRAYNARLAPGALTFLSVCSGIEAASVAWNPLGWRAIGFAEIEKFPSAVLAHHYPDVRNYGDFTRIPVRTLPRVDIMCGGTPCQAFSVAGSRRSLDDARGNLTLAFVDLAHAIQPRNVVWENVPGVLSTKDNAFGCFLAGLVGATDALPPPNGRRWSNAGMVAGPQGRAAWRVLDAQYFGLAQRRKRVIVVADFGSGADPAAVLFEPEGVRRDSPPSRETGEGVAAAVAPSLTASGRGVERTGDTRGQDPVVAVFGIQGNMIGRHDNAGPGGSGISDNVSFTLTKCDVHGVAYAPPIARCVATREGSSQDYESTTMVAVGVTGPISHALKAEGADASEDGTGRGTPIVCQTVALRGREGGGTAELGGDVANALRALSGGGDKPHVLYAPDVYPTLSSQEGGTLTQIPPIVTSAVRRLTPVECERLQGFPDNYTRIPWRGKPAEECPDGPRYRALGNSWAVPLFNWLGRRIADRMPR